MTSYGATVGAVYGILGGSTPEELSAMSGRLAHRGAASAEWSPVPNLRLGVRGSPGAVSAQREGVLVFDGAIDNRGALARRLGHSGEREDPTGDGALAAELWASLGEDGLALIAGQFALALWDTAGQAARAGARPDRLRAALLRAGGERLLFASEYKALLALDAVAARPNRAALQTIQNTKWVRPGVTCLEGIHPVAPGAWIEGVEGRAASRRYWDIPVRAAELDEAGHATRLRESFLDTLRLQTAPYDRIGVSLSGGLDSAVVAAGVRAVAGTREVHTFSAGYGEGDKELVNAETVARELGTIHHPVVLDPEDLPGLLPWIVWHMEEPIGREDIAYLFVAAREASQYVDLIVTGFGFDGLFAGLPRHRLVDLSVKYPVMRKPLEEFFDYTFRSVEPGTFGGAGAEDGVFQRQASSPRPRSSGPRRSRPIPAFPGAEISRSPIS